MQSAFIVGGTGQIGRAVAQRFLERGWDVTVSGRREQAVPEGVRFARLDRNEELDCTADVVVDVVAYEPRHGDQLLALRGQVGALVVISSAAVYCDARGFTLDHATGPDDFPAVPVPIPERQRTVNPGDETYATKKRALELVLLAQDRMPATIVRPGAVYGVGSPTPRELYFVKRIRDGRRVVPLAYRGASRFHTTSVRNLAEVVVLAAERPGTRVVNCGDPDPPTVLEIARTIASHFDHEWTELLLPGPPQGRIGETPWSVPAPFVLDMVAAEIDLRYRPVTSYRRAVGDVCDWIAAELRSRDWREAFPEAVPHMEHDLDYAAEDEFIRRLAA
jgi:nucleoside-diphosphate-sugar epimerase